MSFIHNGGKNPHRMPVILRKEDEDVWLDPNTQFDKLQIYMKPFSDDLIDAYPIKMSPKDFQTASPFDSNIPE